MSADTTQGLSPVTPEEKWQAAWDALPDGMHAYERARQAGINALRQSHPLPVDVGTTLPRNEHRVRGSSAPSYCTPYGPVASLLQAMLDRATYLEADAKSRPFNSSMLTYAAKELRKFAALTPSALSGEGERDRLVTLWHATEVGNVITLPALLGMTDEQYSAWVRDPSAALPSHQGAGEQ